MHRAHSCKCIGLREINAAVMQRPEAAARPCKAPFIHRLAQRARAWQSALPLPPHPATPPPPALLRLLTTTSALAAPSPLINAGQSAASPLGG